jgi:hypothetical protein
VKAPRVDEEEVEPFEVEEIQALLTAALKRRNGVRFVLALTHRHPQGRDDRVPMELAEQEDEGPPSPQTATATDLQTRLLEPSGLRGWPSQGQAVPPALPDA